MDVVWAIGFRPCLMFISFIMIKDVRIRAKISTRVFGIGLKVINSTRTSMFLLYMQLNYKREAVL